jgi:uncharacterized protein GlcG (DUF336 family)
LTQAIAQGALEKCRADNYHISVPVLDASGLPKVSLRDDGSGEVNFTVSRRKAFTALTYKRPSAEMEKAWATMSPGRIIEGVIGIAGGLPIKVGEETMGGVGGAPGGDKDEACAAAGLAKVADLLKENRNSPRRSRTIRRANAMAVGSGEAAVRDVRRRCGS